MRPLQPDPPPDPVAPSTPPTTLLNAALMSWLAADPHTAPTLSWAGSPPCPAPDLARAVSSFAALLSAGAGVVPGPPPPPGARPPPALIIGLYLGPGPAWVAAALGCWASGCAFASLLPGWPPVVAAAALARLDLAALVWADEGSSTPGGSGRPAWPVSAPLVQLPPGFPSPLPSTHPHPPPAWWPATAAPSPFCYALPTSGTTTPTPRFVLGTWKGVEARAGWAREGLGLGREDRVACLTGPTAVDAVAGALIPLLIGASVVCADPGDPASTAAALAGATTLTATPSAWAGLLAAGGARLALSSSLRLAISSGEPLPRRLAAAIEAALPPNATFLNVYGLTEAAGDSTAGDVRAWLRRGEGGDDHDHHHAALTVPAGFPVAGAAVWVTRDPSHPALSPAAAGEEGLVVISGPGVAAGYSGEEEAGPPRASASCFVATADGARAFLTGDRGFLDPLGALHLCGRVDRVMKGAGGARVDLDAVEAAVAGGCPGVVAAAALALPGDLAASVGLAVAGEAGLTSGGVRAWAAASLPPAAQPGAVAVLPSAFPLLGPGGKLDRRALVAMLVMHDTAATAACPPPTPGEATVAAAMSTVLARRRDVSGQAGASLFVLEATSDFVAFGDSLDAAAVAARLGGGATPALILAGRTPRGVARLLAGGGVAGGGVPAAAAAGVPAPPPLLDPASLSPAGGWRVAWRVPLRGCVDAPPTLLGGRSGHLLASSHAGDAVCVEAATGRVAWRAELGAAADEGGAAVLGGGGLSLVAVCLAALPSGHGGGSGGGLAILDATTGALTRPLLPLGGSPRGPPTADQAGDGWWVGTREGAVVRVGRGGEATARFEAGIRLVGGPTIQRMMPDGTAFLVGTGPAGAATLLRLAGGSITPACEWSLSPASAPPVIIGSLVVVVDSTGSAAAFDITSGALAWRAALGGPVAASPVADTPTTLIFPVRSGRAALVALDARSGARLWEVALPGDAAATGAAATPDLAAQGGAVVAVSADSGTVAAFSTATGALLAAARLPDAAYGGPVAISPTLIACGCRDDAVWGLELCLE